MQHTRCLWPCAPTPDSGTAATTAATTPTPTRATSVTPPRIQRLRLGNSGGLASPSPLGPHSARVPSSKCTSARHRRGRRRSQSASNLHAISSFDSRASLTIAPLVLLTESFEPHHSLRTPRSAPTASTGSLPPPLPQSLSQHQLAKEGGCIGTLSPVLGPTPREPEPPFFDQLDRECGCGCGCAKCSGCCLEEEHECSATSTKSRSCCACMNDTDSSSSSDREWWRLEDEQSLAV